MKIRFGKLITRVTVLSAILIVAAAASAQAQSLSNRARFNIPFDFAFGERKLPAGQYSVGRALQSSDDVTLSIADRAVKSKGLQLSNAVFKLRANTRAVLVFHRYGDQYFLAQVWQAGATAGRQFMQTKEERELQRQLADNSAGGKVVQNGKFQTVSIVADFEGRE